jgi:hypothetical protein
MTFHTTVPRYQVETSNEQFQSPTKKQAEDIYQKYVNQNVPCEFYLDGELQKEYKPLINT